MEEDYPNPFQDFPQGNQLDEKEIYSQVMEGGDFELDSAIQENRPGYPDNQTCGALEEYEVEIISRSYIEQELSHNSSWHDQRSDNVNSDEITQVSDSEIDVPTGNIIFQGAITPVIDSTNQNLEECKSYEMFYDDSLDIFYQGSQDKEKILAVNKEDNIDCKSKENNTVVSDVVDLYETTVPPCKKTYIRKRKNINSDLKSGLLSLDDLSGPEEISSCPTPKTYSADEIKVKTPDDLFDADLKNRTERKVKSLIDGERTRSMSSESINQLEPFVNYEEFTVAPCKKTYIRKRKKVSPCNDLTDPKKEISSYLSSKIHSPEKKRGKLMSEGVSLIDENKKGNKSINLQFQEHLDPVVKVETDSQNCTHKFLPSHKDKQKDLIKSKEPAYKKEERLLKNRWVKTMIENSKTICYKTLSEMLRTNGSFMKEEKQHKRSEKVKTCTIKYFSDGKDIPSKDLNGCIATCSFCRNFSSRFPNNIAFHIKSCEAIPAERREKRAESHLFFEEILDSEDSDIFPNDSDLLFIE